MTNQIEERLIKTANDIKESQARLSLKMYEALKRTIENMEKVNQMFPTKEMTEAITEAKATLAKAKSILKTDE